MVKLDQAGVCQDGAVFHNDNAVKIRSSRDTKGLVMALLLDKAGKDPVGVLVSLSSRLLHVHRHERRTCLCNLLCQSSEHTVSPPTRATRRFSTRLGPQLEIQSKTTHPHNSTYRDQAVEPGLQHVIWLEVRRHTTVRVWRVWRVCEVSACEPARRASRRLL